MRSGPNGGWIVTGNCGARTGACLQDRTTAVFVVASHLAFSPNGYEVGPKVSTAFHGGGKTGGAESRHSNRVRNDRRRWLHRRSA